MNNTCLAPVLTGFTTNHLRQALALSTEMGWPYRVEDWEFAQRLGSGFALEQEGRLIGTALRWDYGDAFSSIGMIIIAKKWQGCGLGARIVDALLEGTESRSVILNATREAVELYRRRGFIDTGTLNQHQGVPAPLEEAPVHSRIRPAGAADLPRILRLDEEALGMPRPALLEALAQAGGILLLDDGDGASGYAVYRRFGRGHVIGPVVAQGADDARILVEAAVSRLPGEFVRVDTAADSGLSAWLEARGLPRVDTAGAMLRGAPPQPSGPARVFALCSQSLG